MNKFAKVYLFIVLVGLVISTYVVVDNLAGDRPLKTIPKSEQVKLGGGCEIRGCSGEICGNEEDDGFLTPCVFYDHYACFRPEYTTCEVQASGQCGWTKTAEFNACMDKLGKSQIEKLLKL